MTIIKKIVNNSNNIVFVLSYLITLGISIWNCIILSNYNNLDKVKKEKKIYISGLLIAYYIIIPVIFVSFFIFYYYELFNNKLLFFMIPYMFFLVSSIMVSVEAMYIEKESINFIANIVGISTVIIFGVFIMVKFK
jgi:hypothetical protein